MKTFYLILIGLVLNVFSTYSQKEAYNWDYGGDNVITFNTPDREPEILTNSILTTWEGCTSISDSTGKFLFSSNGLWVFNYIDNQTIMKFNDGVYDPITEQMNGGISATQSSIIVKKPESDSIYYIFTAGSKTTPAVCSELGYNYSIVDLRKNEGKGEIVELNNLLYAPSTEQLTAVRHGNGTDIWIITHREESNIFDVFLLTKDGVDTQNVVSSFAGTKYSTYDGIGYLKSNLQGNLLANAGLNSGNLEILTFDNLTGKISLLLNINLEQIINKKIYNLYGVEFSNDNTKLYLGCFHLGFIIQMDITDLNIEYIKNNIHILDNIKSSYAALQIAPNGKIYISSRLNKLYVINNPNIKGDSCDLSFTHEKFTSNKLHVGLPNILAEITDFSIKITTNTVCVGDDLILTANPLPDYTSNKYTWTLPEGSEFEGKVIEISNANLTHSGLYKIKVNIKGSVLYDSIYIEVHQPSFVKISGNLSFCKNGSTTLSAYRSSAYNYKWSTGDTTFSIIIRNEGEYHLTVENEFGCKSYDTVYVTYSEDLRYNFIGEDRICTGDTLFLSTDLTGDDVLYEWSTGETSPSILVTKGGKYILKVRTEAGCEGIDSITIQEFEKPDVAFEKSHYRLCEGESLTIKPLEINSAYNYIWSDGNTEPERTFTQNSELYLIAIAENNCADTAHIKVEFLENPVASILADKTEVCFGEKIVLTSEYFNPEFEYLWSTGETTESITVTESGVYKLFATNDNVCSDSTEIEVKIHPDLALELLADNTKLCFHDSTSIYPASTYAEYLWSSGETTPAITVKDAGIYELIVKNEFGCADTAEIEIFKYDAEIQFDKEKLIFDELCVGNSKIENLQFKIETETEFTISSITTSNNLFEIVNYNSLLKTYKNGEIVNIEIRFNPQDAGIFDDELVLYSNTPCEYSKSIPISASAKQIIEFSFDEIYSEAGESIEIPLYGQIKCPAPQNLTTDYEIEIAIDKEYFAPESVKLGSIIQNEIIGNERVLKIASNGDFRQIKSEINVIYGKALLGRSEPTPIIIEDVKLAKSRYEALFTNGWLSVDGCVNDIATIQMFAPTRMSVSPNPSGGELKVNIGTQEDGSFRLVIFDVQGREVYRTEFTKSDKTFEQKDYNINTQNLGNGIYTIHLTAPWTLLREQVVVVR
ncbi:MAG: T9SS type A sorting domain-containing protein [Candidatus Kapabacteria bacterium]|nr:T9SS type A sorting domain-containing protein [Ignavibacteriota bacterium]MCW5883702.1 T9SS type A sorting domain-containing protein [Candidatus Kapabacteria bacterium]